MDIMLGSRYFMGAGTNCRKAANLDAHVQNFRKGKNMQKFR
jgi:hypothetical protein